MKGSHLVETLIERGSLVTLDAAEQEALRALIAADPKRAREVCMVKEGALAKAASGQAVRAGTAALIREGLRDREVV